MLALCQHNGATYYAKNYAGIIGASLLSTGNWNSRYVYYNNDIDVPNLKISRDITFR